MEHLETEELQQQFWEQAGGLAAHLGLILKQSSLEVRLFDQQLGSAAIDLEQPGQPQESRSSKSLR